MWWVIPVLIFVGCVGENSIIDDLKRGQGDVPHATHVRLPEKLDLATHSKDVLWRDGTKDGHHITQLFLTNTNGSPGEQSTRKDCGYSSALAMEYHSLM